MKFSYPFIKQLVPSLKNKKELIDKLIIHSFEAEDGGGNLVDISIPSNRYSDAASHWGIAREISAILGKKSKYQISKTKSTKRQKVFFKIKIENKKLCERYEGQYFDLVKVVESPHWMQKILIDCGLRPINGIVDVMNYVMLETGQPLHAFDYDKLISKKSGTKTIIIRLAQKGEKIKTLDDKNYVLSDSDLVIADEERAIAIAGIKGGKDAEVHKGTKRILVEAANFEQGGIYKSSKRLNLATDASLRFAHGISPELTEIGLQRVSELMKALAFGKAGQIANVDFSKSQKKIIKFGLDRLNSFIGFKLDFKTVKNYLECLGFNVKAFAGQTLRYPSLNDFLVEIPGVRQDIETFEDLAEEVARLYGLNNIKPCAPRIHLIQSGFEDQIVLKDKIRKALISFGFSEVYNYSFVGEKVLPNRNSTKEGCIELENPISVQFKYLRQNVSDQLLKNIDSNFRFLDSIMIFEIGKIFHKEKKSADGKEELVLGIAIASKEKETFFELKGVISKLFKKIGLVDYFLPEMGSEEIPIQIKNDYFDAQKILKIESGNLTIGHIAGIKAEFIEGFAAIAQINLQKLMGLISGEHEYQPLPKYPSVMRDISVVLPTEARIGRVMQAIQEINREYIEDVDLIDEYKDSFTFRIVFQSENRTLKDSEVNKEMEKIEKLLSAKFGGKVR